MSLSASAYASAPDGSPESWAAWMEEEEAATASEYRRNPRRLIADHHNEQSITRDYVGREILELLQNANDAAIEAGELGLVRIELRPEGLLVANTGEPFSRAGVDSLRLAHLSPKRARRAQLVGHKGLGFRAILNWARFPFILSGGLTLGYSQGFAHEKQNWLRTLSSELASAIDFEARNPGSLVIPLLAFPNCPNDGDLAPCLNNEAQQLLYARASELRVSYDTVIGMPFDESATAYAEALAQIGYLRPEVLLFAPGLEELVIVNDGQATVRWGHIPQNGSGISRVCIGPSNSGEFREWHLRVEREALPPEYLADATEAQTYEIVLAVPVNHRAEAGYLYSYFPTEVFFPYGVVAHASLDLVSNRQQFQPTKANEFIVTRLAALLADSAADHAARNATTVGLEMLVAHGHHGEALLKLSFREKLIAAARGLPLVPTLNGEMVLAKEARRAPGEDASWLPARAFPTVVKTRPEQMLASVLEELGTSTLGKSDWTKAANLMAFETMNDRAAFIAAVLEYRVRDAQELPLLLDSAAEIVPPGTRVFLSGPSDRMHSVPKWMELRFLHPQLHRALESRLGTNDQAQLVARLATFGVTRYSLDSLLGALVARANQWAKENKAEEFAVRSELLHTLRALFPEETAPEKRPRFPDDAKLLLLTQAGTFEDVRTLYLGEGFGERGAILQELYASFAPAKLLARPAELGLADSLEHLHEFFCWLGVASLPREIVMASPEWKFQQHVITSLHFPLQLQDTFVADSKEINEAHFKDLKTIDGLDEFLLKSDPVAILAWLAYDDRAVRWKFPSGTHGQFGNRPHHAQYPRFYEGPIPS
jgi:hypothetical protein